MNQSSSGRVLHITVGAAPNSRQLDLTNELRLLKAALLYADRVKLCSLASSLLVTLVSEADSMSEDGLLELFYSARSLARNPDDVPSFIDEYKALRQKKRRNRQELLRFLKSQKDLKKATDEIRDTVFRLATDAGADGILTAINSGLVELQLFDMESDKAHEAYFGIIADALSSGQTYPLLDDTTGNLVNLAIQAKILNLPSTSIGKAKQVGLSSGLLHRLPLFDSASLDEIIDIRRELEKPLVRFRSAIIGFSREIESAAWEAGFPHEVEQVFFEHMEPAVLEIEEAYRSNSLLLGLLGKLTERPFPVLGTSLLGILLANVADLPETIGLTTGVAIQGFEAVREWRERNKQIEKNQLYFYYGVKKSLE